MTSEESRPAAGRVSHEQTVRAHMPAVRGERVLEHVALVTGSSRGVGAAVAILLAERGHDLVLHHRDPAKAKRVRFVANRINTLGRRALVTRADLTVPDELRSVYTRVEEVYGQLDLLVLNASGGMEESTGQDYSMRLNRDAQSQAVDLAIPLMRPSSRIVFVTSHQAHFHGRLTAPPQYEPVAAGKRAGEDALRARQDELSVQKITLVVVSGDIIEGTSTVTLLDRAHPGLVEGRKRLVGDLPDTRQFATAIVDAAMAEELETGATVYVGSTAG